MKKTIVVLALLTVFLCSVAFAEIPSVNDLTQNECVELLNELKVQLGASYIIKTLAPELDDEDLAEIASLVEEEQTARFANAEKQTLQKGSKGEDVQKLQERLIELNYLSGTADGDYGGKTQAAVQQFQSAAGLTATGVADADTQKALFASSAPKAKAYRDLDFSALSRDPDKYVDEYYQFSGKVLQVLEQDYNGMTYVALRVATKGGYDNVVYVEYLRGANESRILKDDRVAVKGKYEGLYTYETIMGGTVTLPEFFADTVSVQ